MRSWEEGATVDELKRATTGGPARLRSTRWNRHVHDVEVNSEGSGKALPATEDGHTHDVTAFVVWPAQVGSEKWHAHEITADPATAQPEGAAQ